MSTQETAMMQLTAAEYGAVARLIKGDPRHALDDSGSLLFADALAAVCMMHARRTSPVQAWETWRDRTIADLTETYGELAVWRDDDGRVTTPQQFEQDDSDQDQDAPTVDALAADLAGAPVDPTVQQD